MTDFKDSMAASPRRRRRRRQSSDFDSPEINSSPTPQTISSENTQELNSPRRRLRRKKSSNLDSPKINLSPTPEAITADKEVSVPESTTDPPQRLRRRRRRSSDSHENDSSTTSEAITVGEASISVPQNDIGEIRTELHQELIQPLADDYYADESHNYWSTESEPLSDEYCHFLGQYE